MQLILHAKKVTAPRKRWERALTAQTKTAGGLSPTAFSVRHAGAVRRR